MLLYPWILTLTSIISHARASKAIDASMVSDLPAPERPQISEQYQLDLLQYGDYMGLAILQLRLAPIGTVPPHIHIRQKFHDRESDSTAFSLVDRRAGICALVFRGTRPTMKANWTNLRIGRVPFAGPVVDNAEGLFLHKGFFEAYKGTGGAPAEDFKHCASQYPTHRLLIAGHSQGGALATVAAASLAPWIREEGGSRFQLVTMGSPRVGNRAFARYVGNIGIGRISRYVSENDPIPHSPLYSWGFVHIPGEVYTHNGRHYQCREDPVGYFEHADKKRNISPEDPDCSWKRSKEIRRTRQTFMMAHTFYLGKCFPLQELQQCAVQYEESPPNESFVTPSESSVGV